VMDEASTDGSFTVAQTSGMERRGNRRDTRQDCRQAKWGRRRGQAPLQTAGTPELARGVLTPPGEITRRDYGDSLRDLASDQSRCSTIK
jgi:hypothetical protein